MNTTVTKTARGRKPLNIKFPQGAFTVDQLFDLNSVTNGGFVKCELTARNHIKRALKADVLVKLPEKAKKGTVGAPAFKFILKTRHEANAAKRLKRAVKAVPASPAQVEGPEVPAAV